MKFLNLSRIPMLLMGILFLMSNAQGQGMLGGTGGVKAVTPMSGNPVKGYHATKVEYSSPDRKIIGSFYMEGSQWVEKNNQGSNRFTETGRDEWSVYLKDVSRAGVTVQLDLWVKKVICKPWNSQYIVTAATGGYSAPAAFPNPNAYYTITARHSGKSLDVPGASTADLVQLQQYTTHNGANQLFKLKPMGGGYYAIQIKSSGKYLDVNGASTSNGAGIIQYPYHGGPNQQFRLQDLGGGYYRIIAKSSGKAFDITGGTNATANGVKLQQYDAVGGYNQHFKFSAH